MVATTDSAKARRTIPWKGLALVELALAATAVLLDLFIPALVIVALLAVSLVLRRQGLGAVGLHRLAHPWRAAGQTFLLAAAWSVVGIALLLPVLEHLTGQRQDVSGFTEVEDNVGLLAALVAASWVFAFVEELAFRGYVLQRIRDLDLGGSGRTALLVAVVLSSVLFGLIHTEQGAVGVLITTVDGMFFGWVRLRFGSVWASVLVHGFSNTIGLTAFFLAGPVYGLW